MFKFFYQGMKVGQTWPSMYYLWFGVRRIVMALVVVFFSLTLTFYINTGFWVVIQWAFLTYIIIVRPYKHWWHTLLNILSEIVLGLIVIFHMAWDKEEEWTNTREIGIQSFILGFVVVICLAQFVIVSVKLGYWVYWFKTKWIP